MPVELGIRPEHLKLANDGDALLPGCVSLVESRSEVTNVYVSVAGASEPVLARLAGQQATRWGDTDPAAVHVFGADGREIRPHRSLA